MQLQKKWGAHLHGELIVLLAKIFINAASNERKSSASPLTHDDKAQCLKVRGEIVGRTRQVQHDLPVSSLAKTNELVVLSDDLRSSAREVQRERRLVSTEVVDVKDELLGKVLGVAPHNPADTGVDKSVLVARDVDGGDLW